MQIYDAFWSILDVSKYMLSYNVRKNITCEQMSPMGRQIILGLF